jgi:hypothetical protein
METSLLHKTFVAGVGVAGLAVGFVGGYLVAREPGVTMENPPLAREARPHGSSHTASGPEQVSPTRPLQPAAAASTRAEASDRLVASLPPAGDSQSFGGGERSKWVRELPNTEIPLFIEGLCAANSGPGGMDFKDQLLIRTALKKWGEGNRQAVLDWVSGLPNGPTKRFLFSQILETLVMNSDPDLAVRLAKDFHARDPGWNLDGFREKMVGAAIDKAWKNPTTTARDMLELYKQLPINKFGTNGSAVQEYPENFDFRVFLDGLTTLVQNGEKPKILPTNTLTAWAKNDPQAATTWLMETMEKNESHLPFIGWRNISEAFSSTHGSQAFYEWAAKVLEGASEKFLRTQFRSSSGSDVLGIAGATQNPAMRDRLLTSAIGGSDIESSIRYLSMISTPPARLEAISKNRYTFQQADQKFELDDALFRDLGLTREQVQEALKSAGDRQIIRTRIIGGDW